MKQSIPLSTIYDLVTMIADSLGSDWRIDPDRPHYIIGLDELGIMINPSTHEPGMLSITTADCAGGAYHAIGTNQMIVDPTTDPCAIAQELTRSVVPPAYATLQQHRQACTAAQLRMDRAVALRDALIQRLPFAIPEQQRWNDGFCFTYTDGEHQYPVRVTVHPTTHTYCINGTGGYTIEQATQACAILVAE